MLDQRKRKQECDEKIEKWNASSQIENEMKNIEADCQDAKRNVTENSPKSHLTRKTRKEFILRKDDIVTSYDDKEKVVDMFNVWSCLFLKK